MKNQHDPIEKQLQIWMQQNPEKAPEGFSDRLMQALPRQQQQPLPQHIFKPLLSKRVIAFLLILFAGIGWFSTYFISIPENQETDSWLQRYRLPDFSLPVAIDGTLLAIVVAAMFFLAALDIFLKHRMGSH
jgi:hypothetical protein